MSFLASFRFGQMLTLFHSHSEEIEAQHQKLRESLRGVSRKRHREAAKRERKKGAAKRATGGGGAAVPGPEEA